MRGIRRLGALAAAGTFAVGLAMAAPSGVVAAGTGCGSSFTLAQGQSTQCSFAYSGPNANGDWTTNINMNVTSDAGFAHLELHTADGVVRLQCEAGQIGQFSTTNCDQVRTGSTPEVPVGTIMTCVVRALGPDPVAGSYACSSGT
jgi:hypothetical protein